MQIIKLSATDSTNAYLKSLAKSEPLEDLTVVVAHEQFKGRGQMGSEWQSEAGKNLTFSILKRHKGLAAKDRFQLTICVSIAIISALKELGLGNLAVKWPNDILSGNSKICGILIENALSGDKIQSSIIGIGLNVNQSLFNNLKSVSSLKLLLGKTFDLNELLLRIVFHLESELSQLTKIWDKERWVDYENLLFRKDRPSTFEDNRGQRFMGIIRGVSGKGMLKVSLENGTLSEFDLKEVKLLY
ncbi:biotin--[acetyl-CoA-carboxylase] ligase [Maribacter algicola]|uniref:Biotin--[acetyl-CoA-carboxylase] ligase n=1 Tax=Meishania litoralis TaxID=3434685 RepID=A0ACC7LP13_9FLAO